ncbi:MAG: pitrilysin family protein [Acidobacteriota bacterium]
MITAGKPKDFVLPTPTSWTLDNGMRATLVPFGRVPKVEVRLVVRTGNIDESAGEIWLSDLAGALLKEGAGDLDGVGLARAVALTGGELSVRVGLDATTLTTDGLSERAPQLIELLGQVVTAPAFPESEFSRVQKNKLLRLADSRTRPATLANMHFFRVLYGDHPYGRTFPTDELLSSYCLEQAQEFYAHHYGARRVSLYVVGLFDLEAVRSAVERAFAGWRAGRPPTANVPEVEYRGRRVRLVDRPGAAQSAIRFGLPVIDPSHPDYLKLLVTDALLGGYFGSRIVANLREDKGYTYSPHTTTFPRYQTAYWALRAYVDTPHTGAALQEVVKEIERLSAEPPPAAELEGVKTYLSGLFVRVNSGAASIARQLDYVDFHGLGGRRHLETYTRRLREVTPQQVQRTVSGYLQPENMVLAVAGDRQAIEAQLEPFGELID